MFYQSSFNHRINDWDVSQITMANGVFRENTAFNRYLGDWNVAKIQEMYQMFNGATQFKQNLEKWGPLLNSNESVVATKNIFRGTACEETVWDYKSSGIVCCGSCSIPRKCRGGTCEPVSESGTSSSSSRFSVPYYSEMLCTITIITILLFR